MQRLIDADALKKSIGELKRSPWFNSVLNLSWHAGIKEALEIVETCCIDKEPTIDAVPVRHGKWEYGEDESGYDGYYCSKCFGHVRWYGKVGEQSINFIKKYNYCPNCGARMDEE